MSRSDAIQQYKVALRAGQKYFNAQEAQHKSPYLAVLDELTNDTLFSGQQALGVIEIPLSLVVGTFSAGRKTAFAGNYMPILPENSEFAGKWVSLCDAHLSEGGIRDAIKCMEFLGRFYVIEGHKRVSVLKSFGAPSIMAEVTRMVPVWTDTPEIKAYYEFMRFYKQTGMYDIQFTEPGSYARLLDRLGYAEDHVWTHDERANLLSIYMKFSRVVTPRMLVRMPGRQVCDVMLECMEVYSPDELIKADDARLQKLVMPLMRDFEVNPDEAADTHISMRPEVQDKGLVRQLLEDLSRPDALKIAFIYSAPPESSEWTAAHDEGRRRMEEAFENQVLVRTYIATRETADAVMETAVADGAQVIFVTAPLLMGSARRIAAMHPGLKVLVCALSVPYTGIRTYYARVYEAKFVLGAIAGTLCGGEPIGCVAQYPILGVPAAINAFALGARMTCPDARVLLEWSCMPGNPYEKLMKAGARLITGQPGTLPSLKDGAGLFEACGGGLHSLAREVWNWGRMYQKIVRSILDGGWEQEDNAPSVNYWWGMNGGVINVRLSEQLTPGASQLADILRSGMVNGSIQPFLCEMKDQRGTMRLDGERWLTPIEIMQMNWLSEYVTGILPKPDEVLEMSRETTRLLALPEEPAEPKGQQEPSQEE